VQAKGHAWRRSSSFFSYVSPPLFSHIGVRLLLYRGGFSSCVDFFSSFPLPSNDGEERRAQIPRYPPFFFRLSPPFFPWRVMKSARDKVAISVCPSLPVSHCRVTRENVDRVELLSFLSGNSSFFSFQNGREKELSYT